MANNATPCIHRLKPSERSISSSTYEVAGALLGGGAVYATFGIQYPVAICVAAVVGLVLGWFHRSIVGLFLALSNPQKWWDDQRTFLYDKESMLGDTKPALYVMQRVLQTSVVVNDTAAAKAILNSPIFIKADRARHYWWLTCWPGVGLMSIENLVQPSFRQAFWLRTTKNREERNLFKKIFLCDDFVDQQAAGWTEFYTYLRKRDTAEGKPVSINRLYHMTIVAGLLKMFFQQAVDNEFLYGFAQDFTEAHHYFLDTFCGKSIMWQLLPTCLNWKGHRYLVKHREWVKLADQRAQDMKVPKGSLLDQLMESMPDQTMRAELIVGLIIAGHDGVSIAVATALGKHVDPVDSDDVTLPWAMDYLRAVGPVLAVSRQCQEECLLTVGDKTVRILEGTPVVCTLTGMPFAVGTKSCLGYKLAAQAASNVIRCIKEDEALEGVLVQPSPNPVGKFIRPVKHSV